MVYFPLKHSCLHNKLISVKLTRTEPLNNGEIGISTVSVYAKILTVYLEGPSQGDLALPQVDLSFFVTLERSEKGFPSDENGETDTAYGEQELPYVRKIQLENIQII